MPQKLLFIDSSALLTVTFEEFFRGIGFDVACAATCSQACALLEKFDSDVVVTDFDCPFVNGNKVVQELTRRATPIPVIAHVCHTYNVTQSPLIKEVVLKPASIFQLLEAVDNSLSLTLHEQKGRSYHIGAAFFIQIPLQITVLKYRPLRPNSGCVFLVR